MCSIMTLLKQLGWDDGGYNEYADGGQVEQTLKGNWEGLSARMQVEDKGQTLKGLSARVQGATQMCAGLSD